MNSLVADLISMFVIAVSDSYNEMYLYEQLEQSSIEVNTVSVL